MGRFSYATWAAEGSRLSSCRYPAWLNAAHIIAMHLLAIEAIGDAT